jgi:hypothetical protein
MAQIQANGIILEYEALGPEDADLAASIPGAELRIMASMGHDFPRAPIGVFADAITAAASRAP